MSQPESPLPTPAPAEPQTMEQEVRRATREAALIHARLGNPVAALRDGKVVWLQPAEVFALLGEQEPVKP